MAHACKRCSCYVYDTLEGMCRALHIRDNQLVHPLMHTVLHLCHLKKHLLETFPRMDYMLVLRLVTQEDALIDLLDQAVIDLKASSPMKIRAVRLVFTDTLVAILKSIHEVHAEHSGTVLVTMVAAAAVAVPEPSPEFITIPLLEG